MKEQNRKKLHLIITIVIGTIVPTIVFLNVYEIIRDNIFNINLGEIFKIILVIGLTTVSYYGILNLLKPLLESFTLWTQKESILKSLTILITSLSVISLVKMWDYYDISLSYNDKGIILEMIGFFIYLNPISERLTNFISSKNDKVDQKLMVRTTAITLVLVGLLLQFSYFI